MSGKNQILIVVIVLVCLIFGRINAEQPTSETQKSDIEQVTNKLIILTQKPVSEVREDLEKTIHILASIGDPAIPVLMNHFNIENQDFSLRHAIIRVLGEIGSNNAKATLKEIALSKKEDIPAHLKNWAANHFIQLIQKKEEVIPLLEADNPGVLNVSLIALQGMPLDSVLVEKVGRFLMDNNHAIRWAATEVLEKDPCVAYYDKKVDAIMQSINRIYSDPNANTKAPRTYLTYAQIDIQNFIKSLSYMEGPLTSLKNKSGKVDGTLKKNILFIARAMRGDSLVKNDIYSIIKDKHDVIIRLWAVRSLGNIGTITDIKLLQNIKEKDEYSCEKDLDVGAKRSEIYYPVREEAQKSIQKINKK